MKVSVLGAGGVGLGLASCLAEAGVSLHLQLRRPEAADTLRRRGLRRFGVLGEAFVPPARFAVASEPDPFAASAPDFVLVCTKNTDRDAAAEVLARAWPHWPGPPAVVLCLNGWGAAERFARAIPPEHVFNAVVTTGFRRRAPTEVEVTVHGDALRMGSLFGASHERIAPLCEALSKGGLPSEPTPRMEAELWAKLLYNCALNPLAALLDVPYGFLGEGAGTRHILEAVVAEVFAVIEATGRSTKWPSADAYLDFFFRELLPATRGHESSMLQDLRAGRATEIDALSGAVVQLGRAASVPTPVNEALATLVRARHPRP